MKTVTETLLAGGRVEFSYRGAAYLIQEESNKGWAYLSLWRTAPDLTVLARVFFDALDGLSGETVRELYAQPFSDRHTVGEILRSPECAVRTICAR